MSSDSIGRHLRLAAGVAALLLILTGCATGDQQQSSDQPTASSDPAPDSADAESEQTPTPADEANPPPSVALALAPSAPVSLSIPTMSIDSELIETGMRDDRTLEVPPAEEGSPASWYTGSATPGSTGVAVLLGHVSSLSDSSGVFYDLRTLRPGDEISVTRADGATAVFAVYKNETYPKDEFPTKAIYFPAPGAEIRLITCDAYDEGNSRHANNLVVYAKLISVA